MKTPTILITVLTVAALGSTPAVASAGPNSAGGCSEFYCGGTSNHNEVLVTSTGG